MKIGKKIKRVIAFLAIPLMLLDSVSAYAAELGAGFRSAISADMERLVLCFAMIVC